MTPPTPSPGKSGENMQNVGAERKEKKLPKVSPKCPDQNSEEAESFLRVKFQKLVVSATNTRTCRKIMCEPVLKSEAEALKIRNPSRKSGSKTVLRKSKLGESFKKFRTPSHLNAAIQDSKEVTTSENQKIFGRKFSLSLENFGSLSLLEQNSSERTADSSEFTTESFKKLNGSGSKRKRATTPEQEETVPAIISCGQQARLYSDVTADELAGYLEDTTFFPKRMSYMAEMMYT